MECQRYKEAYEKAQEEIQFLKDQLKLLQPQV